MASAEIADREAVLGSALDIGIEVAVAAVFIAASVAGVLVADCDVAILVLVREECIDAGWCKTATSAVKAGATSSGTGLCVTTACVPKDHSPSISPSDRSAKNSNSPGDKSRA